MTKISNLLLLYNDGDSFNDVNDAFGCKEQFQSLRPYLTTDANKDIGVVGFVGFSENDESRCLHVILPKSYPMPLEIDKKKESARLLLRTLLKFRRRHFDLWNEAVVQGEFDGSSFFPAMEY